MMSSFNAFNLRDELPHVVYHHHHHREHEHAFSFHYYYYCYSFCCCLCAHPSIRFIFLPKYTSTTQMCACVCVCDPHLTHTFASNSTPKPYISMESECVVISRVRCSMMCACQTVQLSNAVQTGMFSLVLTVQRRTSFLACIITAHKCQIHYTALFPIYRSHSLRRTQ